MSVEPTSSPESAKGSSFWTSLPGLLTAISGLLTALVAVGAFLYQVAGSDKDDSPAAAADTSTSANQVATSPKPAPSPSAPAGGADDVLWHDTLLFSNYGIDFDEQPPVIKPEYGGMDTYDAGGKISSAGGSMIAKWAGSADPSAADCADLVTREGKGVSANSPAYFKGARFCMRTGDSGYIVLIKFVSVTGGEAKIDATVWAPR
ncbi:hypothetical protein HDA40_007699 [Hamadaea flava]|uniref:Uncharacterized protein n=1 Tax=Hamadaea flava TaxID=1742688 RepID=A0ABV8LZ97_9ACTN|nr:hypothetical protein [Hamadaea flava]MCP2329192.1 hypothetical protein [Hamadaea flava]